MTSDSAGQKVEVLTRNYGNERTGANTSERTLNTANVNAQAFGKLFLLPVDDQIYAGLLYAADVPIGGRKHNVVYVATVNNSVYAFDADRPGPPLWQRNFNGIGRPTHNHEVGQGCRTYTDFIGNIGIVGTPVISPDRTMYFVTRTVERGNTVQNLHAVDIATGRDRLNSPRRIEATVAAKGDDSNDGVIAFNAVTQNQRAALAFSNGVVYVGWASFCDTRPYHGWMMAYSAATLQQVGVFNASPNENMSGIWMSGAGPAFDRAGNLYVATGNGSYDGRTEFGEALVKLSPRRLVPIDFFAPSNYNTLNEFDLDFGTQGPTLLPGTDYMVIGGKEGKIYLLDSRDLGGEVAGDLQIPQMVQVVDLSVRPTKSHHLHNTMPAWRGPQGVNVYVWGESDYLRAFRFDGAKQRLTLPAFATSDILPPRGMPGGMMTISSNGSVTGSGIVWATLPRVGDANHMTVPGNLYAFDAETLKLLWSSEGPGDDALNFAKGSPAVVANGKVYVASLSKFVSVYGLKEQASPLQDLALNHEATGSEPCEGSQAPAKAFNGGTQGGLQDKWCSNAEKPFLQVDLGKETRLGRFVVEHAGAGGEDLLLNTRDFNIQLSLDGEHFETAASVWGNIQSITTHDIPPTTARYVRLNVVTPAQVEHQPANIYELEVFSPVASPPNQRPDTSAQPPAVLSQRDRRILFGRPAPPDVKDPPAEADTTDSHLAMKILRPGTGSEHPDANDCATVAFTAWERDGSLFSTSTGNPEVLCLSTAILGVREALERMTTGEMRRLWVPADLTFREGQHHAQPRPDEEQPVPHHDLTIDLEMISLLKAPAPPADLKTPPESATRTPSGLAYEVLRPGTDSAHPGPTSIVTVHVSGWTSKGKLFESTVMGNHPVLVPLASAMAGWREGLSYMTVGEKARFWIPAAMAYGAKPANDLDPAGDLVFEIELLAVR